jgi:ring-1,2-phenylacetyl-CoA epoxidase subunit PaaD
VVTAAPTVQAVREVLAHVHDPEIPVITIDDLGILRDVSVTGAHVQVTVTPTYSGCPAMDEIRADITAALAARGWDDVEVRTVLAPAWTTDWMSEDGRRRLREFGIAPPGQLLLQIRPFGSQPDVACPQCGSGDTQEMSRFASTSCKSLWRCRSCREPFDHFKAH